MQEAFFQATQNALSTLTSLCDLIHPITVSMWNTRSQVIGTYIVNPNVTPHQMAAKYGLGSSIHGVNFKKVFKDTPWEIHEENIAWLFLNNIFPIYEGWLEELHNQVFSSLNGNISTSFMQFPSSCGRGNIVQEITRLTANESSIDKAAFYSQYSLKKYRCFSKLDNFLVCFRYFKEIRNCYMHNNMLADVKLIDAYNAFRLLTAPSDLCMSEIPKHYAPILNKKIQISLRGVIGFSQIIIQIMVTSDAELLRSKYAEAELLRRLSAAVPTPLTINSDRSRAIRQIKGIFKKANYITPDLTLTSPILRFLIDNHFIYPVVL